MRDIELLTKETQQKLYRLVELCDSAGYAIKITDTLRTRDEQNDLYKQGRTVAGNIVTNVYYPNSMHNWGIAFDICRNDGAGAYNNSDGFFNQVGKIGVDMCGLEWGGNWTSFKDLPHFQLPGFGSTPKKVLIPKYGTPDVFIGKSVVKQEGVKRNMPTVKIGSRGTAVKVVQAVVGSAVDGIFGAKTFSLVVDFQNKHQLSPDGIVGGKTWETIFTMMETS